MLIDWLKRNFLLNWESIFTYYDHYYIYFLPLFGWCSTFRLVLLCNFKWGANIHISLHWLVAIRWCPNRLYARAAAIWAMVTRTNHIGWKLMIISSLRIRIGMGDWYGGKQWADELIMWQSQTGHLCWPSRPRDQTLAISGKWWVVFVDNKISLETLNTWYIICILLDIMILSNWILEA